MKKRLAALSLLGLVAVSAAAEPALDWANWQRKITDSFQHMRRRKVPGRVMGLLVPADNREDILPLTAAGYNVLTKGGFHTVVVLLQAPPDAGVDGLALPLVSAFDTSFGRFAVDTDLRDKLNDGSQPVQLKEGLFDTDPPPALARQLAFLKFLFKGDAVRLKVLPIYVSFSDPNSQVKDYAPFLVDHLRDRGSDDVLIITAANLTRAESSDKLREADGSVLRAIRNLDVDGLLEWASSAQGAALAQRDVLCMMLLTLRWGGADHAEILAYGDTAKLVLTKDKRAPLSYAAAAAASAPPRAPNIPHVDSDRVLQTFDDPMRIDILTMTRQAALSAIDPTAAKPPPLGHKAASKPWAVYVSIYDAKGALLGQAGTEVATGPLEESLRRYAVDAVRQATPRLTRETFKTCVVDVSVPFGFNVVSQADDLIPLLNGVVVKATGKSYALHPDAWRKFTDPHQLLAEAAWKLDLPPWAYALTTVTIDSFRTLAFNEKEPSPAMISPDSKLNKNKKKQRGGDEDIPDLPSGGGSSSGGGGSFGF